MTQFSYPPKTPTIAITRTFDAPRSLVWEAFTKTEHIVRWWGPRRYKSVVLENDMRVGGKWRFAHVGEDGKPSHEFFGEYLEIVAPERVTATFGFLQFPPLTQSFTLTDIGGKKTRFDALMTFDSVALRDGMVASGMEGGARETYEKLDELLQELAAQKA